jgi:hypothetical protein
MNLKIFLAAFPKSNYIKFNVSFQNFIAHKKGFCFKNHSIL